MATVEGQGRRTGRGRLWERGRGGAAGAVRREAEPLASSERKGRGSREKTPEGAAGDAGPRAGPRCSGSAFICPSRVYLGQAVGRLRREGCGWDLGERPG